MSGPQRLREGAGSASRLLQSGARPRTLSDEQRTRSYGRVRALGAVPIVGAAMWLKGVALAAGLCTVGVVAASQLASSPPTPRLANPFPTHLAAATEPSAAVNAPREEQANAVVDDAVRVPVSTAAASERTRPITPRPGTTEALAAEVQLIEAARGLLRTDAKAALAKANAHATQFPSGQLAMERELVAVDALARLHRTVDARARAAPLLGGIYDERVRRILDASP